MKSYEDHMRKVVGTKYPNLTPAQASQVEKRVGEFVARYREGLALKKQAHTEAVRRYQQPQTRTQTQEKEITRER